MNLPDAPSVPADMSLRTWRVLAALFLGTLLVALSPAWASASPTRQMASEIDVKVNAASRSGGTMKGEWRSGDPIASTLPAASIASTL